MRRWMWMGAAAIGLCLNAVAAAQEDYVSISALNDQVQAMGGVWRGTYETPDGPVVVDAPVIVPDVEQMPVITVKAAPFSETLFERIMHSEPIGRRDEIRCELELDGEVCEFFLGNIQPEDQRYENIDAVWVQHGDYRTEISGGLMQMTGPSTFHFPWMIDPDQPCMRGSDQTLGEAMVLWAKDIALCYPEGEYVIAPKWIVVRGSTLVENEKDEKRDGYFKLTAEQILGGIPVFGAIASRNVGSIFSVDYVSTPGTNRESDRLEGYRTGAEAVFHGLEARSSNDKSYRTETWLADVRTVEQEDIPLAPLERVLRSIEAEIKAGKLKQVYAVRLGYLLYSNPEMTDYAWAIPRWVVSGIYVPDGFSQVYEKQDEAGAQWGFDFAPWEKSGYSELPLDAQSGEWIFFTTGSEEVFSVPRMTTWEEVSQG